MAGQKPLTLLIVMLSIAFILGRPAEENANDLLLKDQPTSNEKLEPKYQLISDTFNNFKELSLNYVNEAKNITEHILKDESLLAHSNSKEIEEFKKNLTDFWEKSNTYQEDEELFDLVDIFANATEFYMKLPKESITPDTSVIIDTLKKYGSDKLEEKCDPLFKEFVDKFIQQFEANKEYFKDEKDMLEWFDHFKTLPNVEDQAAALETFGQFY